MTHDPDDNRRLDDLLARVVFVAVPILLVMAAAANCTGPRKAPPPPRPPSLAAELHQALVECKAQHGPHNYAAVNLCFAEARREIEARHRAGGRR